MTTEHRNAPRGEGATDMAGRDRFYVTPAEVFGRRDENDPLPEAPAHFPKIHVECDSCGQSVEIDRTVSGICPDCR